MWVNDKDKIDALMREMGAFRAVNYVAQKARKLKESVNHVISDSQAVEWAISDVPPDNLEYLMRVKKIREDESAAESDRLSDVLSMIERDDIRIAVLNSYKLSIKSKQLVFDYNGIKDKGVRTRIRILTKMVFIPDLIEK